MKYVLEKTLGFNDNFFVVGNMLPVYGNILINYKLANIKRIRLRDFRHSVHLF